jgi:hypothetical protein
MCCLQLWYRAELESLDVSAVIAGVVDVGDITWSFHEFCLLSAATRLLFLRIRRLESVLHKS